MQEKGLTNEGRHHLLLLHKQAHDKRSRITAHVHVDLYRARLTACEVGVSQEKYHNSRNYAHPTSLKSNLSSSAMGIFSGEYCLIIVQLANYVSRGVSCNSS